MQQPSPHTPARLYARRAELEDKDVPLPSPLMVPPPETGSGEVDRGVCRCATCRRSTVPDRQFEHLIIQVHRLCHDHDTLRLLLLFNVRVHAGEADL